eukprot:263040_1
MIDFHAYSGILSILPIGIIFIISLQIASDISSKRSDRVTTTLLYAVYMSSLACACVGFSLHLFDNVIWCEKFGMIPCFSMLGGSKAILYLFFIRRAKLAQGITMSARLNLLLTYIGPAYLFIYWIAYCFLTTLLFSLKYTPHDELIPSNCSFDTWALWFLVLAGCIDVFNCLSTLYLFLSPLLQAIHSATLSNAMDLDSKIQDATHMIRLEFITLMKWNVALSSVATMSSVLTLVMITVSNHYIWLFCLGDPFINSVCTYGMVASNREYVKKLFCVGGSEFMGRNKGFSLHDWVKHGQERRNTELGKNTPPKITLHNTASSTASAMESNNVVIQVGAENNEN